MEVFRMSAIERRALLKAIRKPAVPSSKVFKPKKGVYNRKDQSWKNDT